MQKNEEKGKVRSERKQDPRDERLDYRDPKKEKKNPPDDPGEEPAHLDEMRPEEMGA